MKIPGQFSATINSLVRKIHETEERASWVEALMTRVRNLMGRSDLPKDLEKETQDLDADWNK